MTLHNLIQAYTWSELEDTMFRLYPDYAESLDAHATAFNDLKTLSPSPSKMRIVLSARENVHGGKYTDVSGMDGTLWKELDPPAYEDRPNADEEVTYAIEFEPWEEWLSMEIDEETVLSYSGDEILVHCLFEMTFCGYSAEEVAEALGDVRDRYDDAVALHELNQEASDEDQ